MRTRHAFRRTAALAITAAAAMLFVTACSGGGDKADSADTGGGERPGGAAFTAYADCLRKNGVTITVPSGGPRTRPSGQPRPSGQQRPSDGASRGPGRGFPGGGRPDGVDDATWEKAQQACASVRPSGRPGGFGRGGDNGANAAYRNCLRDHGVPMGQGRLETADPTVAKAMEACKVLRPSAAPSS